MKKIIVIILLLFAATSYAGQKAITDTGEEVILNSDGTWEYSDTALKDSKIIGTSKKKFNKPKESSFLLKSIKNKSAYWINTQKWSFKKSKTNPAAEYEFQLKGKDLYGMTITEEVQIPIETLANVALDNARNESPNARIVRQEYRIVNGQKVMYMEISGSIQGIKFTYLGYYYSDSSGTTQLVTYTATSLVDKYKSEINDLLNGLVKQ